MNAFEYLSTLPLQRADRLYEDPWACQAVFQSLSPLAQQVIMRLLFIATPSQSLETFATWIVPTEKNQQLLTSAVEKVSFSIYLYLDLTLGIYICNMIEAISIACTTQKWSSYSIEPCFSTKNAGKNSNLYL